LSKVQSKTKADGYIWLDYCQPSKEDLVPLMDFLHFHPLSIEDCLDENQLPKMEDFQNHTFLIFNAIEYTSNALLVHEVNVFIGKDFLVTVSRQDSKAQPLFSNMDKLVELSANQIKQGPAFLLHILLDKIVDQKFLAIESIEDTLDNNEEVILTDLDNFDPSTLLHTRKDLLAMRKSLFHEREIIGKISRLDSPFIPDKAIYFYRDIHDHLSKFYELSESSRDLVTSLMEMYLSMINNQMAKAANQTNIIVRRLTLITTIFMPLTLISGIGGMSEFSMMTGPQNWKIAYSILIFVMFVIAIINYILLKRLEKKNQNREV
ncbi:MAG: magnesium transporter CorA family protein, partial [Anaerolineaceae bacterium]|nr:magnesium transporter CorA family protein [Anaerolineaceae bacterium]